MKLTNTNPSPQAVRLFDAIAGLYRHGILSGQQESTWNGSDEYEFDYICEKTGK